jgi:signal transduction histidine kinase
MKPNSASFLFFCLLLIFFIPKADAQSEGDSLSYYVKFIQDSKKNNDLSDAISYLKKQNILHKQNNHSLGLVYNYTFIASAERKIGLLYEAERTAVEALKLLDQMEVAHNTYRIPLYNFLGILYFEHEDFKTSLTYYNRVLDINENPRYAVTINNNIGKVYFEQKKYATAIKFYEKAYNTSLDFDSGLNTARALDNLGFTQSKLFNSEALSTLTKALKIRQDLNYQPGLIESYLHLGEYYSDRDNKEKAIEYATKALKIADSSNNKGFKKATLTFYTNLSNAKRVLELNQLIEQIEKDNKLQSNRYASQRYNLDLANEEINEIKITNEKHKRNNIIYTLLALIIALMLLFFYFILKAKHKKEKLQQVYLTESRISKQIHDDVSNDLFQVMTKLESKDQIGEALKAELNALYYRTRDISKEHSVINNDDPFVDYLGELIESFNDAHTSVIVKGISDISWEAIEDLKRTTIYKVLQELLINMRKHSNAELVALVFNVDHKKIQINYSDNGIGCDLKKHTGLQNTENRITSINGSISFVTEPGKGFKVKMTL